MNPMVFLDEDDELFVK